MQVFQVLCTALIDAIHVGLTLAAVGTHLKGLALIHEGLSHLILFILHELAIGGRALIRLLIG